VRHAAERRWEEEEDVDVGVGDGDDNAFYAEVDRGSTLLSSTST
jgi:hypothetical protein